MATVVKIIDQARRKLGIQAAEEPLQDHEAQEGMAILNDMLQLWVLERVIMSAPRLDDLTETVSVETYGAATLVEEANEPIAACLAVRLADHYGMQASPTTVALCSQGKTAIMSASFDVDGIRPVFDGGLTRMPSQRKGEF